MLVAVLVVIGAYLVGAVPFGWIVARSRGVDLFKVGSGNIGATNVGRVLGRKYGILVFVLDFLKGAAPTAIAGTLPKEIQGAFDLPDALSVGCAVAAFLGHLFPIYLGFRGGKGVATGFGTVFVLVPGPATLAVLAFLAVTPATRIMSLGSIAAVAMLCVARAFSVASAFGREGIAITLYCLCGSMLVVWRHRANIIRMWNGTENRLEDKPMFATIARSMHVLSLGLWFGGAVMFNFIVAPTLFFESFPDVVRTSPSDRTANLPLAPGASEKEQKDLATALSGAAVGPIFPKFFALQGVCAFFVIATACGWWRAEGRIHRRRVAITLLAGATVAVGWPISLKVSALRVERFTSESARAAFGEWHTVSLFLSLGTAILAGIALAMAAKMPAADPYHAAK